MITNDSSEEEYSFVGAISAGHGTTPLEYIYCESPMLADTDHKPFTAIFKDSLEWHSCCLQKLKPKLQTYIFALAYPPLLYLFVKCLIAACTFPREKQNKTKNLHIQKESVINGFAVKIHCTLSRQKRQFIRTTYKQTFYKRVRQQNIHGEAQTMANNTLVFNILESILKKL